MSENLNRLYWLESNGSREIGLVYNRILCYQLGVHQARVIPPPSLNFYENFRMLIKREIAIPSISFLVNPQFLYSSTDVFYFVFDHLIPLIAFNIEREPAFAGDTIIAENVMFLNDRQRIPSTIVTLPPLDR